MARPAIAAGMALALMETLADFGTVSYFGVQTFTTGIYRAWFSLGDRVAAAQLSTACSPSSCWCWPLERVSRGRRRFTATRPRAAPPPRHPLERLARRRSPSPRCALPLRARLRAPVRVLLHLALGDGRRRVRRALRRAGAQQLRARRAHRGRRRARSRSRSPTRARIDRGRLRAPAHCARRHGLRDARLGHRGRPADPAGAAGQRDRAMAARELRLADRPAADRRPSRRWSTPTWCASSRRRCRRSTRPRPVTPHMDDAARSLGAGAGADARARARAAAARAAW